MKPLHPGKCGGDRAPQPLSHRPSHKGPAPHRGAEIFPNSYFCNISEIKAKRVKIPIKTHLTSLVPGQSASAWRQVSGSLRQPWETIGLQGSPEPGFALFRVKAFSNQDQFNSVI